VHSQSVLFTVAAVLVVVARPPLQHRKWQRAIRSQPLQGPVNFDSRAPVQTPGFAFPRYTVR
jgi:hypothetical protein